MNQEQASRTTWARWLDVVGVSWVRALVRGFLRDRFRLAGTLFLWSAFFWLLYLLGLAFGLGVLSSLSAVLGGVLLLSLFLLLFVGDTLDDDHDRLRCIGWMVRFCYFFTLLTLVLSIAPFAAHTSSGGGASAGGAPLRIEKACARKSPARENDWVLPAVLCQSSTTGPRGRGAESAAQRASAGERTGQASAESVAPEPVAEPPTKQPDAKLAEPVAGRPAETSEAKSAAAESEADPPARSGDGNQQWVLNVGGLSHGPVNEMGGAWIEGGIVVPLYVVILALMGGAVSMTRRVPELQHNAWSVEKALVVLIPDVAEATPGESGKQKRRRLAAESFLTIRDKLVFEIMQVVSAPVIALVVVYVMQPESGPTTALLGFGAGFASKTVLYWIRAVLDALQPQYATERQQREFHPEDGAFAQLQELQGLQRLTELRMLGKKSAKALAKAGADDRNAGGQANPGG